MNAPDVEQRFWSSAACIAAQAPTYDRWATYERIKALWQSNHPYADHIEHEAAMARIARLVGV